MMTHFSKFGCCKRTTLPKKTQPRFFSSEVGEHFQDRNKEKFLMNSSKYIKKKKIKQVLQKTGGGT